MGLLADLYDAIHAVQAEGGEVEVIRISPDRYHELCHEWFDAHPGRLFGEFTEFLDIPFEFVRAQGRLDLVPGPRFHLPWTDCIPSPHDTGPDWPEPYRSIRTIDRQTGWCFDSHGNRLVRVSPEGAVQLLQENPRIRWVAE